MAMLRSWRRIAMACARVCAPVAPALAGAAVLACAAAVPAQAGRRAAGRPSAVSQMVGVNIPSIGAYEGERDVDQTIAQARALHVRAVRVDIPWSALEPRQGESDERLIAITDRLVADASSAGIRVIAMVDSTPCWASSAPAALLRKCVPGHGGAATAWAPSQPAPYASFVAMLARRYGSRLGALEIWNEPDQANEQYFAGPGKAVHYAALLRAAYPAIKAVQPSLPVIAGSLVGANGRFLRDLYAAGIKGYYDGLAVHFYTLTLAALRSIHEVQLTNGDSTPLWLDEFGWTSCWPHQHIQQEQGCVTRQVQARNLSDTIRALAHTPYVAAVVSYTLRDAPGEEFGVLTAKNTRKPSFSALARVFASQAGAVSPVRLSLRRARSHVIASGSGPVGDFMGMEVLEGGALRYRAVFTLNRFNRFSLTLPAALGTHGLVVHVFQYWTGAARFAQASI
jgi:hypothetical protein